MRKYKTTLIELKKRIFYIGAFEKSVCSKNLISEIKRKNLTILMTPFTCLSDAQINIPNDNYHNAIINYLRNGEDPAIVLSNYHLDRLIIETIRGEPKQPRIFIQGGTEIHPGFIYYREGRNLKKDNELSRLVDKINPRIISIGGAILEETEKELKEWNLNEYPLEYSADSGCYVGPIYLFFRDKYPTRIANDLVLMG